MTTLINISLLTYLTFVAIIGTLGNGVILLAYGNRWNSSKSTSVIFILILACVDLWTCLIVVPTIAIMEYREFVVPSPICRFYSFSKNLIIISSFIMSFIALDRFLNIALPHYRLLNPRRVKVLLTLFISIGIALGTLTALAFSTQPIRKSYLVHYNENFPNKSYVLTHNEEEVFLDPDQNSTLTPDVIESVIKQITASTGAEDITILNLEYKSTHTRCFADTTIISETIREILKNTSNKVFYTLIGIVTVFYTITYVLALHRQNPRIRALKKSLNVLNKFDSYPSGRLSHPPNDSIVSIQPQSLSSTTVTTISPKQTTIVLNPTEQQYEMSKFLNNDDNDDDSDDQNLPSPTLVRKTTKNKKKTQPNVSISEGTSDDLKPSTDKLNGTKQVSFQIENCGNTLTKEQNKHLSVSTVSFDGDLDDNNAMYYKLPCPCSTTRQFLIKFHFARPSLELNKWFCCSCCTKKQVTTTLNHHISVNQTDDEPIIASPPIISNNYPSTSTNSDTLRRQLHRHRLQQIRMASTFLIITVSFVLFYLPSILNAERIIKSPIMIYYLYLCTHALNPIIYCFMNPSLRAYVISMFNCCTKHKRRISNNGRTSFIDR